MRSSAKTVDEYLLELPEDRRQAITTVRKVTCGHNGISDRRIENFLLDILEKHVLPRFDPAEAFRIWKSQVTKGLIATPQYRCNLYHHRGQPTFMNTAFTQ